LWNQGKSVLGKEVPGKKGSGRSWYSYKLSSVEESAASHVGFRGAIEKPHFSSLSGTEHEKKHLDSFADLHELEGVHH